ncbi:MAG: hypothetical protein V2I62_13065 [Bacteroidales bacterium]|jgi:hypothetical protein|nr:hypothetical protein [Bacteroidales bacterium]
MRFFRSIVLLIICTFFALQASFAQKIDTIVHVNGDVLTGDLKKMIYGVATWKMDGMGTINFEEVKIRTIKSPKLFEIKMKNGFIYFGSFDTSGIDRKTYIVMTNGRELVDISEIVEVYPIRRNFWMRTSGNFSLGLNYSKGSTVTTLTFSGNLTYRKKKSYWDFNWDDNNTFQADTLSSSKVDATLAWQRLLKNHWSSQVAVSVSQNSELGTKRRTGMSIIGIRDLAYNNWNRFYAGAGLSVTNEIPYGDAEVTNDLLGVITLVWKVYKFTAPKVWVDASIAYLPYFTDRGRHRISINLNPQVSVIGDDLKVGFTSYYAYDSKPSGDASSSDDYGVNLTITYSFH